MHVYTQGAEAL